MVKIKISGIVLIFTGSFFGIIVGLNIAGGISSFTSLGIFYSLPVFVLSMVEILLGLLASNLENRGRAIRCSFLIVIFSLAGFLYFFRGNAPLLWLPSGVLYLLGGLLLIYRALQ